MILSGKTSSHTTRQKTLRHSRLSLLSHCGLILFFFLLSFFKLNWFGQAPLLIFFFLLNAGWEWIFIPSHKILACVQKATTTITHHSHMNKYLYDTKSSFYLNRSFLLMQTIMARTYAIHVLRHRKVQIEWLHLWFSFRLPKCLFAHLSAFCLVLCSLNM